MTATVIEVWAPTCASCRAMRPDLEAVAEKFAGPVELRLVNVADDPDAALALGARATPTLIGLRDDGDEVFRISGRRSRAELQDLFALVASDRPGATPRLGLQDLTLRVGAGLVLMLVGLVTGMVWPLIVAGGAIALAGLWAWHRGNRTFLDRRTLDPGERSAAP